MCLIVQSVTVVGVETMSKGWRGREERQFRKVFAVAP